MRRAVGDIRGVKKSLLQVLKIVGFSAVGFTLLYLVFSSQSDAYREECIRNGVDPAGCSLFDKIVADFAAANWWWIALTIVCYLISNLSRTARWMMLVRALGYRPRFWNGFWTVMLGYFGNLGFPRAGEVLRPTTFSSYENIPLERALGTIVVDRIADVLSLGTVVALAMVLEFEKIKTFFVKMRGDTASESGVPIWLYALGGLFSLTLGMLWFYRKRIQKHRFYQKGKDILIGFREGLMTISRLERPWLFVFHSVVIWVMYFLMTWLAFYAFAPTYGLPAVAGLLVFVFGAFGIVIPTPGGMGAYHFLVGAALSMFYGLSEADAFSFANLAFFSIQIGGNVLFGLLATLILPLYNRTYRPLAVS